MARVETPISSDYADGPLGVGNNDFCVLVWDFPGSTGYTWKVQPDGVKILEDKHRKPKEGGIHAGDRVFRLDMSHNGTLKLSYVSPTQETQKTITIQVSDR